MSEPFRFFTRSHVVFLLGMKATNPTELMEGLRKIPVSSIYFHSHRLMLGHRLLTPSPPNDFAYWVISFLDLEELGEQLASVDILSFSDFEQLREEYIRILSQYLARKKRVIVCTDCHEFYFMTSRIFIMPTSYNVADLREFVGALGKISPDSIFHHMIEARLKQRREENDFSLWLRTIGEHSLADDISGIDPYSMSLEGLRRKIIDMGVKHVG